MKIIAKRNQKKMQKLKKIESALLFLTILFLPTQLGRHFWPSFSFVYSIPVDYLSPTIYFWDILVGLLIAIFLIQGKRFSRIPLNIVLFFLLTQLTSLAVSFVLLESVNVGAAIVRLEQYLVASLFGLYIASTGVKERENIFFYGIIIGVLFESLLGIAQFFYGQTLGFWFLGERSFTISTPAIAKFDFYGLQFLRPYGTFPHPNIFAAFLIINLFLLSKFTKVGMNVESYKKLFFTLAIFFSTIGIMLSTSRSAIVIFFSCALFLYKPKRKMLILLIILISPFLYTRFSSLLTFDNLSLLRREYLIEMGVNIFSRFPVTGIGLNNFITFLSNDYIPGPGRFLQPVHNIYLLALCETGIIGVIGWVVLIRRPLLKKFNAIWFTIFFLGLFDHFFLTLPQGYRLLFLVWGLSVSENS